MASLAEVQQQLAQSLDQIARLSQEVGTLSNKVEYLHRDATQKDGDIQGLRQANAQLADMSAQSAHDHGGKGGFGSLIDTKSMAPRVFRGIPSDNYKTWAEKVRAFCNASRPGFKKFLLWIEDQDAEIDLNNMSVEWMYKDSAAEILHDFLMIHTDDDARILVELHEDNGPEAWRQLARRYDPIGESYAIDKMDKLMNVTRCKTMLEPPAAISRWERSHANYVSRSGGKAIPEDFKVPILFRMIPRSEEDKIKLQHKNARPEEKTYHVFSRMLIELAGEKAYDQHNKSSRDDMDCSTADAEQKYSVAEWEEYYANHDQ